MDKIKCYTVEVNNSTLTDSDLDNILETLKFELEEMKEEGDICEVEFGIKYLTQEEINNIPEFDGF